MHIVIKIKKSAGKRRLKEFINAIRDLDHIIFGDVVNTISLDDMNILDLEFDKELQDLEYELPIGFDGGVLSVIEGFVNFGDVSRKLMGFQCQYGSRYVDGKIEGYPNLGEGLRFSGDTNMYHSLKIHKDDVKEFMRRYKEYVDKCQVT